MRTFIALDLPDPVKHIVIARQQELERALREQALAGCVRWTTRQNLHLTLRFLGDTTPAEYKTVDAALADITAQQHTFSLHLHAEGVFPNYHRPNILWIDFGGERRTLEALQKVIEAAVRAAGFAAEERPFKPHLTIGRMQRSALPGDITKTGTVLQRMTATNHFKPSRAGSFSVGEVQFIQSVLQPDGPVYTPLSVHRFDA